MALASEVIGGIRKGISHTKIMHQSSLIMRQLTEYRHMALLINQCYFTYGADQ